MQPVPTDEPLPHEVPLPAAEPTEGQNRGQRANEFLRFLGGYFDKSLNIYKLFYFFFFAAFGSVYPLMAVYFKQLGMNAAQAGTLIGIRPLIQFFAAPFWTGLAEKWRKCRLILIVSTACWLIFTVAIAIVNPAPFGCLVESENRSTEVVVAGDFDIALSQRKRIINNPHERWSQMVGENPIMLDKAGQPGLAMPRYSTVVYSTAEIGKAFVIILFLMIIGEFTSAPANSLADIATQAAIEGKSENYGRQRMFGSIGWGIAMFIVGIGLDLSTTFFKHPCRFPAEREKNYIMCFATFTLFMLCALAVSTQFHFDNDAPGGAGSEQMYLKVMKDKFRDSVINRGRTMKDRGRLDEDGNPEPLPEEPDGQSMKGTDEQILEQQLGIHGLQHQQQPGDPQKQQEQQNPYSTEGATWQFRTWIRVLPVYLNPRLGAFLFVTFFMGIGNGIVFSLLFWHLQDIGGGPTLFGVASIVNHISELLAYMHSDKLINSIGHIRVLYLGLLANICRFLFVSWVERAWWVLPFEFLQGLTHAATWAAVCSYISQNIPVEARPASQGLLQGVHHGLGRGLGAIFGGLVTAKYGSDSMLRSYGFASTIVMLLFAALNFYWRESKLQGVPPSAMEANDRDEEPQQYLPADDSNFLAPHGVPLAQHRENSSSRLNMEAMQAGARRTRPTILQHSRSSSSSSSRATATSTAPLPECSSSSSSSSSNKAWAGSTGAEGTDTNQPSREVC
ncbi:hypothetical protein BOX15_Mlig034114g2 [Macrostomum lignano]|uniref:Major facilitator superfamily associated domain-containing protein n=1 Tax=Macrostomum lignano TaxID=282301 RepID=A0A267FNC8_9PLAT|nr:hypothetical protein BOX15_Mlig034114g2 [Macrostomum lignano]